MRLLDFLFGDDDLPVALQVFWKVLCFFGAGVLFYAVFTWPTTGPFWGRVAVAVLATVIAVGGIFTKLGEG